jgi:hypothetical protein
MIGCAQDGCDTTKIRASLARQDATEKRGVHIDPIGNVRLRESRLAPTYDGDVEFLRNLVK